MNPTPSKKSDIETTETGKVTTLRLNTDPGPIIRWGILVVLFGFGGFILWSLLAPLDSGIVSQGVVNVDTKRKTVQHLRGGIVDEILVREGDKVKKDVPLLRLNPTQANAALAIAKSEYLAARANEVRLEAERNKKAALSFPEEITNEAKDPGIADLMRSQRELFQSRRRALEGELAVYRENMAGQLEYVRGLEAHVRQKDTQISLLNQELASLRPLLAEQYVPRTRVYDLERALADVSGTRGEDLGNIARTQKAISEIKLRILQREQEFQKDVETALSDVQKQAASMRERYIAAKDDIDRTVIRAPTDGVVVGLNVTTAGGVIGPGEKLMDIVPEGDALIIEAQVEPHNIDKVHVGLLADVRFTSFKQSTTPTVTGKLTTVSADSLTNQRTGQMYYAVKVAVTEDSMRKLGHRQIQPGMPVDVIIKTGERTLMEYLTKPLLDRFARSLKEE